MLGQTNIRVKPNKKKPPINYIEYIESTGTQYIDTEINADYKLSIKADMQFLETSGYRMSGTIAVTNETTTRHQFMYYDYEKGITYWYGTNEKYVKLITGNLTERYTFDIDIYNKKIRINEGSYTDISYSNFDTQLNYVVFARNASGEVGNFSKIRLYSLQLYYDGTLVKDFKPCKDEAGTYCLYDEVEKRYYYNQGTGEFTGGVSI